MKVLLTATVQSHICQFHKPLVEVLHKHGCEVHVAARDNLAEKNGWVMVQDTAWDGYEDIPTWIMQGYGTMALEALEQLNNYGIEKPTHIFIQAGVGSLAGAVQGFFKAVFKEKAPIITISKILIRESPKVDIHVL